MKFHHPPLLCLYLALNCVFTARAISKRRMIRQTLPSKHVQVSSINSNIKSNNSFASLESSGSIVDVNEKHLQGTVWAGSSQVIIDPFDTYANVTARNISSEISLSNCALMQASSDFLELYVTSNRTADDGNSVFTQIFEGSTNFSFIDTSGRGNRLMLQAINANRVITGGYTQQLPAIKQYTLTVEKDRVLFDADHSQYDATVQIDDGIILIDNGKTRLEINENRTVVKIYGPNDVMTFTSSEPYKIYFDSDSIRVSHEEEEIVVNHDGEVLRAYVRTPSRSIFTNDGGFITMDRNQSVEGNDVAISAASLTVQMDSKGNVTMDISRSSINMSSPIEKTSVNSKHSHLQSSIGQPHIIINTNLTCVEMEHRVSSAPELWELQKPTNFLDSIHEEEVTVTPFPFPPLLNVSPIIEVCPPNVTSLPIGNATMNSIGPEANLPNMGGSTSPPDFPFPSDQFPINQSTSEPGHSQVTVHPSGQEQGTSTMEPPVSSPTSSNITASTEQPSIPTLPYKTEPPEVETTMESTLSPSLTTEPPQIESTTFDEWSGGVSTAENSTGPSSIQGESESTVPPATASSEMTFTGTYPPDFPFPTLIPDSDLTTYLSITEITGGTTTTWNQTEVAPSELPSSPPPPGQFTDGIPSPPTWPKDYEEPATDFPNPTEFELPSMSTYFPPSNPFPEIDRNITVSMPTPGDLDFSTSTTLEPRVSSEFPFTEGNTASELPKSTTVNYSSFPNLTDLPIEENTTVSLPTDYPTPPDFTIDESTIISYTDFPNQMTGLPIDNTTGTSYVLPTDLPHPSEIPTEEGQVEISSTPNYMDFPNPDISELAESIPTDFPIPSDIPEHPTSTWPSDFSSPRVITGSTDDFVIGQWGSTEPPGVEFSDLPQPSFTIPTSETGSKTSSPRYLIFKWQLPDGVKVEDAEQVLNDRAALLQVRHPKFNRKRLKYLERILKIGETEKPHATIIDSDT